MMSKINIFIFLLIGNFMIIIKSSTAIPSTTTSTSSSASSSLLNHNNQNNPNNNNLKSNKINNIDNFKNKEYLLINFIPDISILASNLKKNNNNNNRNSEQKKYEHLQNMFMVWDVLNDGQYFVTKDIPFTIIVPKIDSQLRSIESDRLKELLLEHLIPGEAFITFNEEDIYGNLNKHEIVFKQLNTLNESQWTLNDMKILRTSVLNEKLSAIFIDGMLGDRRTPFSKRNIQETNRYNEPQRLEMKNVTKELEIMQSIKKLDTRPSPLMTFLNGMKTGTKVFQHFLSKSNLTQVLDEGPFTILIPSDNAFQRWHPIDWGFYPFSVQEFTENILRNHLLQLRKPLRMSDVKSMTYGQKYKTLGGETVLFKNNPGPTVNNITILADFMLSNGNVVFLISEVLFMSEAIVTRLHQMHKDKETPPLLAFPWFGAQFLSHSYLALERDSRFYQITRYLNKAEIAKYISGSNYTFFVPIDEAFERLHYDMLSDDLLASEKGVKMLLNHFVKGRLYDRDLRNDEVFETIGGGNIKIQRKLPGNVTVNQANIIETEIFVYNLGTMYYIDDILYSDILIDYVDRTKERPQTSSSTSTTTTTTTTTTPSVTSTQSAITPKSEHFNPDRNYKYSTIPTSDTDVESIPSEFTEQGGTDDDYLLQDEFITPRALPIQSLLYNSPKK